MYPTYSNQMKRYIYDYMQDIHTAIPGKIIKFDPDLCEATVLPYAKYRKQDGNAPNGEKIDYPEIHNIPVFFMQSMKQTATIVYPIKPDDECILFFAEQSLETWQTKAETETDLRHDLTNAIAIVGLFAQPNPLVRRAYDNESIIIQREETFIEIYDGKIESFVRHKDTAADAYHLTVDGESSVAELSVHDLEQDVETINIKTTGNGGKVNLKTIHPILRNETVNIDIDGTAATLDLITKNPPTGTERAFIKMDGTAATVTVQGYVTVMGSHGVVDMVIPK